MAARQADRGPGRVAGRTSPVGKRRTDGSANRAATPVVGRAVEAMGRVLVRLPPQARLLPPRAPAEAAWPYLGTRSRLGLLDAQTERGHRRRSVLTDH